MIGKKDKTLVGSYKGVFERFMNKPVAYRKLIAEAIFWSAATRFSIRYLPFRTLLRLIRGSTKGAGDADTAFTGAEPESKQVQDIVKAVETVSRRVPWQCKCLVQASAAKILMNKRGIRNTMCLGVLKPGEVQNPGQGEKGMKPHAWLIAGNRVVLGGEGLGRYVEVSRF